MRVRGARLVVLLVALASAGGAALLAANINRQPVAPAAATIEMLVAKADLSVGQVIGDQDLVWQVRPPEAANSKTISKSIQPDALQQFVGAIVREPVATGDPVRDGTLFILKQGMRPVAIENPPGGAVVRQDDQVDVMLTGREKAAAGQKPRSELIVENVRAIAVGKTVVIELTPEQAEKVAQSRLLGPLSVVDHEDRPDTITLVRFGIGIPVSVGVR